MYGGAGDDVFYVTEAGDVVYGGAGTDTVYATVGIDLANFDSVENVTLTGNGPGNITGNDDDNVLKGNSGNNSIVGGAGNDNLEGFGGRSEEHTSELQSLMRKSYAAFCLIKK